MLLTHLKYIYYIKGHVLVSLPLETISIFMLKNAEKKKLWENQIKQNHAQLFHSFKNSFMLRNTPKKLAETKLYKSRSQSIHTIL